MSAKRSNSTTSTSGETVQFIGELGGAEKDRLLGEALALLFPIDWPEPFGLVMIEAMACGTPVVAWRNGSVPEVIEDGVTGFVVDSVDEAVRAVGRVGELDRRDCRAVFEQRYDAARMARAYLDVYRRVAHAEPGRWSPDRPGARTLAARASASPGRLCEPLLRFVPGLR
jgi:glycosyltransferase involved in cell wall biosynthesis